MMIGSLIAGIAAVVAIALAAPASARDLGAMSGDEIVSLQRRLTDAGCYRGALDGRAGAALEAAVKACPDQDPMLRIETGMHTAMINRIGVDAACRLIATASDDKTVRLWSLPDGKLIRTQRLPIGEGDTGKVYAVATSPDGRWIAAGGWDAARKADLPHAIYLFDAATGATVRRLGAFGNVINHLAFSADGRRLGIALGVRQGVRVVDVETGRELMADTDYGAGTYGVAFAPDGSLFAVSYDGFLRRYGSDLKRSAKLATPGGKQPVSVAVDPAGRRLAVGYDDSTAIDIFEASTLQRSASADTRDVDNGDLSKTTWSADGRRLLAGGRYRKLVNNVWRFIIGTWDATGRRLMMDGAVADSSIMSLASCGDGIAFGAADPAFGLLHADGTVAALGRGRTADMRNKLADAFTVSADGTRLRFGLGYGGAQPVLFDIAGGILTEAPAAVADLHAPEVARLKVADWEDKYKPTLDGKPITLDEYERSRSVAVRPDRTGLVLGTEWSLRALAPDGSERWRGAIPGAAWGVNLARNGELVIAAEGDGTVRWYRWSDGKELLALFVEAPTKRWVAWTPSGYYMASPGGEDLIGWHVNRGWEQPADFFPASRFHDRFNRADVVQRVLTTLDESRAVEEADAAARRKPEKVRPIAERLPPVVTIVSPAAGTRFSGPEVTLDYTVRSPSGLAVDTVDVLIDGRPAPASRGVGRTDVAAAGEGRHVTVAVPPQDVELSLIARAGTLASEPARIRLVHAGQAPRPVDPNVLKPKLYVLSVGVADYADPELRLGLAGKDAIDFGAAMKAQQGGLYGVVVLKELVDRDATRDSVMEGLEWLEKQVTSRDIGVVFLAGHGFVDDGGRFWYMPADATREKLRTRGVSQEEIRASLARLAGKAVLFLDACHAAGVARTREATRGETDINRVVNEFSASENGVVVFGSSTGRELSIESGEWGNGAFTKALVEGIAQGKAALLKTGSITLSELDAYVADRVKELTGGRQHPVMAKPATITNFPIATVRP